MKKITVLFILIFLSCSLFAEITAVMGEVSGKVEIMSPGGNWKTATAGMKIATGDFISTGFRSQAVLELGAS